MFYVQHKRGKLDTHIDMPVNGSVYEPGRIMGKGEESNETLETDKRLLDCNGERLTRIYTQSKGWGDQYLAPTYDNRQNHLKLTFREQDTMGWVNLLKGWMGRQWIAYVKQHIHNENIKLQAKEWAPKMMLTLWDHMPRLWQYRNKALNEDDSKRVAQFKVESLDRDIELLATRHNDLRSKLHKFQERQMEIQQHIQTLQHNIRQCWASLAKIYLDEEENRIERDAYLLDQYLQGRVGVG
jgi:hypothetical protein